MVKCFDPKYSVFEIVSFHKLSLHRLSYDFFYYFSKLSNDFNCLSRAAIVIIHKSRVQKRSWHVGS